LLHAELEQLLLGGFDLVIHVIQRRRLHEFGSVIETQQVFFEMSGRCGDC
jgi:hypothetical protein